MTTTTTLSKRQPTYAFVNYDALPTHLTPGLRRYVEERTPVGGFLTACLRNELHEAVMLCDDRTLATLRAVVFFLYNEAPSPCWGSPEKVKAWLGGER